MSWKTWRYDCYNLRMYKPEDIDLFLDIGAMGGDVFLMSRILFPFSRVVGIEPNKESFEILKRYIGPSSQCYNVALGDGTPLWLRSKNSKNGQCKFVPEGYTRDSSSYSVESKLLSQMFSDYKLNVDSRFIIKCDVEGGEAFLLKEWEKSLAIIRKSIQFNIEIHLGSWNKPEDWDRYLEDLRKTHNIYIGGYIREGRKKVKYFYKRLNSSLADIGGGWVPIMAQRRFENFPGKWEFDLYYNSLDAHWKYYCNGKVQGF